MTNIHELNARFTEKQIEAYASKFRKGDAVWVGGGWREVIEGRGVSLTVDKVGLKNGWVLNLAEYPSTKGIVRGFYGDTLDITPYRVTTLTEYEPKEDDTLLFINGDRLMRLRNYRATDDELYFDRYLKNAPNFDETEWLVIPKYSNVSNDVNEDIDEVPTGVLVGVPDELTYGLEERLDGYLQFTAIDLLQDYHEETTVEGRLKKLRKAAALIDELIESVAGEREDE